MQNLVDGWPMISAYPKTFLASLISVSLATWFAIRWFYSRVLESKNAQIELQDRQLDDYREKLKGATPEEAKAKIESLQERVHNTVAGGHGASPPSPDALRPILKNISEIQLVPSGEGMSLVVTPCRGATTVSIFVDVSHWTPSVIPSDWSRPERFYLGEMKLRAANVRFSLDVMGREPEVVVGWLWKILTSEGKPSGTCPWLVHGRQRAVFVFIDEAGTEEKFPILLILPIGLLQEHPIVIAPSDLPQVDS
jgi:hypothetical protein